MTLDELRKMQPGVDRVAALADYMKQGEEKLTEARRMRDHDLAALAKEHGPTAAAQMTGAKLSAVKLARRTAN